MSDLIERQAAIDAIEEVDWYHQNINKDMVSGANSSEHQAWYKADDIYKTLEAVPTIRAIPIEWFETLVNNLKETDSFEKGIFLSDVIDMWRMEMAENGKYEIINTEGSYIIPDGVGGWKRADEKEVNYQYTTDTK